MKALTLTEPYATLVALGLKKIETRSWQTAYRGPMAIHAAKGVVLHDLEYTCCEPVFREVLMGVPDFAAWWNCPYDLNGNKPNLKRWQNRGVFPFGCVIATCQLAGCWPTRNLCLDGIVSDYDHRGNRTVLVTAEMNPQERNFGDYSPGRFAWILEDVQMLPGPIPAKGALGLWEWETGQRDERRKA